MKNVWVNEIMSVSDGKHTRMILSNGEATVTAMYFSNSPKSLNIYSGDKVDVIFTIDVNEWLGRKNVQLIIKDVKNSDGEIDSTIALRERFNEIWNGAEFSAEENVLPTREDFVAVYKFILASSRAGVETFSHRDLSIRLSKGQEPVDIGYIKLKIIIRVFQELNVLGIDEYEDENYRFTIRYTQKTNLEKSGLLRRFKNQQKK